MALCTTASLLVLVLVTRVATTPVRFDQRQNGSFNVQVDLKDLEVYAIVEDEMLEGAMAQATESVKPRPNIAADPHEGLKVAASSPGGTGTRSGGEGVSATSPATSPNAPRRPNDKLANIKHKTLLPHERSDTSSSAELSWEAAESVSAAREEELEPRGSTSVEARAAPAPAPAAPGTGPIAAAVGVPPAPSNRAAQSQGVRPAGTVSVAHLHCGLGYYRDQNGRCRRSRRPSSSNTRKNHHHHHGNRKHRPQPAKDAVKDASKEPSKEQVKEPSKDVVKDVPKEVVNDSPKEAVKEAVVRPAAVASAPAAPAGPGKGATKESASGTIKETVHKDQEPLKEVTNKDSIKDSLKEDKVAVKDVPKEAVKDAAVKVQPSKVPVKDLAVTKDAGTKPAVAKPSVQDRISSSSKNNNKEAVKQEDFKYVVKPPVRESVKPQVRQPAKPSPSKTKEAASKVPAAHHSHHHSQHHGPHKITVVKEDGKSRVQVPQKEAAVVPVAVVAAKPQAPASPTKRH